MRSSARIKPLDVLLEESSVQPPKVIPSPPTGCYGDPGESEEDRANPEGGESKTPAKKQATTLALANKTKASFKSATSGVQTLTSVITTNPGRLAFSVPSP